MSQPQLPPRSVILKKSDELLSIIWGDGELTEISGVELRRYCACAGCRSRKVVGVSLINEASAIEHIHLLGKAALQIAFADGHERGIYPWGYLHAIAKGQGLSYLGESNGSV